MSPLLPVVGLLLTSAVIIYIACEFFVNGVEWVGRRLAVGQKATGTILAAFGTALPESAVTFVAVAFGATAAQKALGIGAALGGPLVLSTIAYGVVGWVLLATRQPLKRTAAQQSDFANLSRDQGWFLVIFLVKIGVGLAAFAWKPWLGLLFLAAYGFYFWIEMRRGDDDEDVETFEPLRLGGHADPSTPLALLQTGLALAVILVASCVFVDQLDRLAQTLKLPGQGLALFLSPIATELPETMNAVIWVRQGKHRLALANICGAMMIQATVPTAFGLFFTPWRLDRPLILGGVVTAAAVATMFIAFRRGVLSRRFLAAMSAFYLLFIGIVLIWR